ncbi:spore germination protein [Fictibacillus enclensis]|uniref:spore germination protein n=1 Tax=Fictibacillus enclensis TaxID=1017270 RepID=UPI0025A137C7|nr:spore germination protein [Fictibacillus enclensis]MDM5198438.1 spore germination protein [Fictibacillus enclensis]
MFFKKGKKEQGPSGNEKTIKSFPASKEEVISFFRQQFQSAADLVIKEVCPHLTVLYLEPLIDGQILREQILQPVQNKEIHSLEELYSTLSVGDVNDEKDPEKAVESLLNGSTLLHFDGTPRVLLASTPQSITRSLSTPELESQVIGMQVAFNESLSTNIGLLRKLISSTSFCHDQLVIGHQSKSRASIVYLKEIASEELVTAVKDRIQKISIDSLIDTPVLAELIEDNSLSIFPQSILTERPDRVASQLMNGKIAIFIDGSSHALLLPNPLIEFFQSKEDQNIRWQIATFLRLLRIGSMVLSIFATSFYVAALTYHYEVIPQPLLVPLGESRSRVPFPPIFETLLLEIVIELLREAGARLPTKVGQTMGIVGGIVIGTAAVQAGFTSNILIIIIALSALASFTSPSYMLGNVIRLLRFPIIILAGLWGFYGIMLGFCFILIHLLRQSTLGVPYLAPFYPPRYKDWKDSIIRFPAQFLYKRPDATRPQDSYKFPPSEGEG